MSRFIVGLFILFCWSLHLFLCQYHIYLLLQLCNVVWNQGTWCLQLCFFLKVIYGFIQILGLFVLFLWKTPLEYWQQLHWICRLLWIIENFSNINSSNLWVQNIFPCICVFLNFFHQCFTVFSVNMSFRSLVKFVAR